MKINKINLLKSFDRLIGPILIRTIPFLLKKKGSIISSHDKLKILFIRPGGIGDAVHLLPSIKELKRFLPNSRIDILAEKRNWEIFKICKEVSNIYLYDTAPGLMKVLRNDYHIVIDTEQWHKLSAVVGYMTGAPVRVGFGTNERERLFTNPVLYNHDDYEVYSFFNLIKEVFKVLDLNVKNEPFQFSHDTPFLQPDHIDVSSWLTDFLNNYRQDFPRGFCIISPGATVRERRWGGERYAEVARKLLNRGFGVIVIGTGVDKEDSKIIVEKARGSIDLTGKTNLMEVIYLLSKTRLFIGPDSGILHLAVGLGIPTVSLFGAGIAKKWAPRGKKHIVINKNLPCSPCTRFGYTPKCKIGLRCLNEITCEEVVNSAFYLLRNKHFC